jgi:hypothetical protein
MHVVAAAEEAQGFGTRARQLEELLATRQRVDTRHAAQPLQLGQIALAQRIDEAKCNGVEISADSIRADIGSVVLAGEAACRILVEEPCAGLEGRTLGGALAFGLR